MADIINNRISDRFAILYIIFLATYILSLLTFGESFRFWEYPLSDLGSTHTADGSSNMLSWTILTLGMLAISYLLIKTGLLFNRESNIRHYKFKQVFCISAGIGSFIFIFPHNINNTIHSVGSGLLVGNMWALATLLLIEARFKISREKFVTLMALLQITVVGYAITYFAQLPIRNVVQKFAAVTLFVVLKLSTQTDQSYELSQLFVINSKK